MKKPNKASFFRHYLIVSLTSSCIFVFIGFMMSRKIMESRYGLPSRPRMRKNNSGRDLPPPEMEDVPQGADGPPEMDGRPRPPAPYTHFAITFASVLIAVFFSTTASILALVIYLRKKADMAEAVMVELKSGKLDSRFPIEKIDEVTHLMSLFNQMADQIEDLFQKVKQTDEDRRKLIQEISHDLKTPLASVRLISDTLSKNYSQLGDEEKMEMIAALKQEALYTSELLENLLFLAVSEDPQFLLTKAPVDLADLIGSEVKLLQSLNPNKSIRIECGNNLAKVNIDAMLIKRAIRNALDNAISFASQNVTLTLSQNGGATQIILEDDGPGFSETALKDVGQKRFNRSPAVSGGGRSSLGLGTVVLHKIVELHGASLKIENRTEGVRTLGSRLQINIS